VGHEADICERVGDELGSCEQWKTLIVFVEKMVQVAESGDLAESSSQIRTCVFLKTVDADNISSLEHSILVQNKKSCFKTHATIPASERIPLEKIQLDIRLKLMHTKTPIDCQGLCWSEKRCNYFVFDSARAQFVFEDKSGHVCAGLVSDASGDESAAACQEVCNSDNRCVVWHWLPANAAPGGCYRDYRGEALLPRAVYALPLSQAVAQHAT
jgi:hypothetical protein